MKLSALGLGLLAAVAALPRPAAADDDLDPIAAAATPAEKAVLDELDKETYVKARTDAENVLDKNPSSFIATWAMARIQHDEEGNHARALYYVRRAEDLLKVQFHGDRVWDKKLLLEEYSVNQEMDRSADALAVLDRYDARYGHGREELRIWPTFKLGRMDEARAIGKKLAASDDLEEREHGFNGMLALEFEAHDRGAAYKWSTEGIAATQGRSCILLRNGSGVAYIMFKLGEAEDLGLRAHEAEDQDCDGGGYDQLAGLYLVEGEFQKAIAALKSLKATPIPKRYRPHYALERRAILADIMFALGKVDDAERLAAEVYALPERIGMTSGGTRITDFVRSFRYWMALDTKVARENERASYRPMFSTLSSDDVLLGFTRWAIRRGIIELVADTDFLTTITRPNLGELFQHGSWHTMELVDVLGTGIMRDAVAAARKADAKYPEAKAYLDLFTAEITYRDGDLAHAIELADAALPKLPREEAMLRWRTMAWEANAQRRLGKIEAARPLYHEVMQKVPSMLRILGVPLPVTTTNDGSELAIAAAGRLSGSPRFDVRSSAPFRIAVTSSAGVVELCLTDDGGFSFACASGEKKSSDDDTVISALDAFHDAAFSPKVSLDQSDLNSLDGSPVRASSDQVLKGILEP